MWFIPGAVVVVAAFFASKANWVIAFFLAVLVGLFAVGFALVSAYNTKKKATDRLYREITLPQLDKVLAESNLTRLSFEQIALQTLPSKALIHQLLEKQTPQDRKTADSPTGSKPNE